MRFSGAPKETDFQNQSAPGKKPEPFNRLPFQSLIKKYGVNPTNGLLTYEKRFTVAD
jgi:hypothetical protein